MLVVKIAGRLQFGTILLAQLTMEFQRTVQYRVLGDERESIHKKALDRA